MSNLKHNDQPLRVAFIAGGLTQGGAEKQLTYMARALLQAGVDVRVFSLTQGDHYQSILDRYQVPVIWVGEKDSPVQRIGTLVRMFSAFRPHIIQSTHFFTNLYAAVTGFALRTVSIGSVRSNVYREVKANGFWGKPLLKLPQTLILNSEMARRNAVQSGVKSERLFVLPNVIDLDEYPLLEKAPGTPDTIAISVARLVKVKRLELFLAALSESREIAGPGLTGLLVGDGPERQALASTAQSLGLTPQALEFTGMRKDIPDLMAKASMFVLTSEAEGFPNAVLEAMAARLPVITTPAGDAPQVVVDGVTGYVVPHNDPQAVARRMVELYTNQELRARMGQAGRTRVEELYSFQSLPKQLIELYTKIARQQKNKIVLRALRFDDLRVA